MFDIYIKSYSLLPEMEEVYRNDVSESGIKGEDYIIRLIVINTDIG